jgi:hypothetical protein
MGLAGSAAFTGRREIHAEFWWGDLREGYHLKDLDVDGRIILKWIIKKWAEEEWIGLI